MATSQISKVIQHLRSVVLLPDDAGMTDRHLLECFITQRDEAAFAALVRRHGPMVWGVCRRVLRSHHDAEDAFQATFLVLVRKAASIASRELLAGWLYGVAYRTSLKANAATTKRRVRERQVADMPEPEAVHQDLWSDLQPLLDRELSRLPEKYRVPVILCELEGKSIKEAARQLGSPQGTLAGRLTRARAMLAKTLARHGLSVSGEALAVLLSQSAASACVPMAVISSTIKAAILLAAGQAAGAGMISAKAAALTEGVMKAMLLTKLKTALGLLVAVAFVGIGVGMLTFLPLWAEQGTPVGAVASRGAVVAEDRPPPPDGAGRVTDRDGSKQVTKVYPLKHASAEQVVVLLRSLFIVVNQQDAYARFHLDETTNSLIAGASGQHQEQIEWVLALVDTPAKAPAPALERGEPEQRVKGYLIKHADGRATVAVLQSLFLVVNHRIAYARFGYDARTHLLIAIASEKHHKQIAKVLELLGTETTAAKGAKDDAEQLIRVYPIKHIDGEQLMAKLRSQFVVVNHQQARTRFGLDRRTHSLIVIAAGKLQPGIRDMIAVFDQPPKRTDKECFSTRQDSTITLHPETATFRLPDTMVNWFARFKNNLHLTRDELAKVENGAGDWDTEYGLVCNAVFPFSRCCAHVGEEGWGKDAVSYGDLQVRVYVLEKTLAELGRQIEERGAAKVKEITKKPPKITTDDTAPWKRWNFAYDRWYGDYGATAHVDFRARQFAGHTVVLVFMYTNYSSQEAKIRSMLESFTWGGKGSRKLR